MGKKTEFLCFIFIFNVFYIFYIYFSILGGSVHTVKENVEALIVASKVTGLEVNAYKTKYMVMSGDQNAGPSHSMKTDSSSFENVKEFNIWERL